jgi:hypothetical protein
MYLEYFGKFNSSEINQIDDSFYILYDSFVPQYNLFSNNPPNLLHVSAIAESKFYEYYDLVRYKHQIQDASTAIVIPYFQNALSLCISNASQSNTTTLLSNDAINREITSTNPCDQICGCSGQIDYLDISINFDKESEQNCENNIHYIREIYKPISIDISAQAHIENVANNCNFVFEVSIYKINALGNVPNNIPSYTISFNSNTASLVSNITIDSSWYDGVYLAVARVKATLNNTECVVNSVCKVFIITRFYQEVLTLVVSNKTIHRYKRGVLTASSLIKNMFVDIDGTGIQNQTAYFDASNFPYFGVSTFSFIFDTSRLQTLSCDFVSMSYNLQNTDLNNVPGFQINSITINRQYGSPLSFSLAYYILCGNIDSNIFSISIYSIDNLSSPVYTNNSMPCGVNTVNDSFSTPPSVDSFIFYFQFTSGVCVFQTRMPVTASYIVSFNMDNCDWNIMCDTLYYTMQASMSNNGLRNYYTLQPFVVVNNGAPVPLNVINTSAPIANFSFSYSTVIGTIITCVCGQFNGFGISQYSSNINQIGGTYVFENTYDVALTQSITIQGYIDVFQNRCGQIIPVTTIQCQQTNVPAYTMRVVVDIDYQSRNINITFYEINVSGITSVQLCTENQAQYTLNATNTGVNTFSVDMSNIELDGFIRYMTICFSDMYSDDGKYTCSNKCICIDIVPISQIIISDDDAEFIDLYNVNSDDAGFVELYDMSSDDAEFVDQYGLSGDGAIFV